MSDVITVNKDGVTIGLRRLQLNLQHRDEMYRAMGAAMLVSIRRTFREQGSPSGSWVPLSPNTIARNPKKYGSGHKLLIDRGILLNSITFAVTSSGVSIGTNVVYAAVQNFGSRDRTGGPFSPQAKLADRAVDVTAHRGTRIGKKLGTGKVKIVGKDGNERTANKLIAGPRNRSSFEVSAHTRHQNIPARPFMVFRPEDPARLGQIAKQFNDKAIATAGFEGI